jgi:pyruvate/2-oxoglutarate/acetoin dehydrogenase E1 component
MAPAFPKTFFNCPQAGEQLAAEGIDAEVIDLRTLKPLDEEAILRSACKTGRVLVVHEASRMCGVGAEVAAIVAEHAFDALKAPLARLAGPGVPTPSSWTLKQAFMRQADGIAAAAQRLMKTAVLQAQQAQPEEQPCLRRK